MRIASLLPAATEIVAALGAERSLVGISHECDYPASITRLPRLTWSPIDGTAGGAAIDREVRSLRTAGRPVIVVDGPALRQANPDLILTQGLCEVCAVIDGDVRSLAEAIEPAPRVLALEARTLGGIFADIRALGAVIGRGQEADRLVGSLEERLRRLEPASGGPRPRVVVIEWLEPLYLAGHWVPEMIAHAGGQDVGAEPGDHSMRRDWKEVASLAPEVTLVALCGFGLERASAEWRRFRDSGSEDARWAGRLSPPVWAIDGNAYTSRPGPRTVLGAELIRGALEGKECPGLVRLV